MTLSARHSTADNNMKNCLVANRRLGAYNFLENPFIEDWIRYGPSFGAFITFYALFIGWEKKNGKIIEISDIFFWKKIERPIFQGLVFSLDVWVIWPIKAEFSLQSLIEPLHTVCLNLIQFFLDDMRVSLGNLEQFF